MHQTVKHLHAGRDREALLALSSSLLLEKLLGVDVVEKQWLPHLVSKIGNWEGVLSVDAQAGSTSSPAGEIVGKAS